MSRGAPQTRRPVVRCAAAAQEDQGRVAGRPALARRAPLGREGPAAASRADRRDLGTLRQLGAPVPVDVNAVEYRDRERPLEVVYFLRALERRVDLRVKVDLDPRGELAVDSVTPLW